MATGQATQAILKQRSRFDCACAASFFVLSFLYTLFFCGYIYLQTQSLHFKTDSISCLQLSRQARASGAGTGAMASWPARMRRIRMMMQRKIVCMDMRRNGNKETEQSSEKSSLQLTA